MVCSRKLMNFLFSVMLRWPSSFSPVVASSMSSAALGSLQTNIYYSIDKIEISSLHIILLVHEMKHLTNVVTKGCCLRFLFHQRIQLYLPGTHQRRLFSHHVFNVLLCRKVLLILFSMFCCAENSYSSCFPCVGTRMMMNKRNSVST